jgi:hypothetical protein
MAPAQGEAMARQEGVAGASRGGGSAMEVMLQPAGTNMRAVQREVNQQQDGVFKCSGASRGCSKMRRHAKPTGQMGGNGMLRGGSTLRERETMQL